jgi:hypothetical protein
MQAKLIFMKTLNTLTEEDGFYVFRCQRFGKNTVIGKCDKTMDPEMPENWLNENGVPFRQVPGSYGVSAVQAKCFATLFIYLRNLSY